MTVIFIAPVANVEPSSIPTSDDSYARVIVALGQRIESNCMNLSPLKRGSPDNKLYSMSAAIPIPRTEQLKKLGN